MSFKNVIEKEGINPNVYLDIVKEYAKKSGYDPNKLKFSDDGIHKLEYENVKFGRVGYGDFILWTLREKKGDTPPKYADKKRNAYLARARKIKGDWHFPTSPNMLAIKILWAG